MATCHTSLELCLQSCRSNGETKPHPLGCAVPSFGSRMLCSQRISEFVLLPFRFGFYNGSKLKHYIFFVKWNMKRLPSTNSTRLPLRTGLQDKNSFSQGKVSTGFFFIQTAGSNFLKFSEKYASLNPISQFKKLIYSFVKERLIVVCILLSHKNVFLFFSFCISHIAFLDNWLCINVSGWNPRTRNK